MWCHLHLYGDEVSYIGSVRFNKIIKSLFKVQTNFNDNIMKFKTKIADQATKVGVLIQIHKENVTVLVSILTKVCFHYHLPSPLIDLVWNTSYADFSLCLSVTRICKWMIEWMSESATESATKQLDLQYCELIKHHEIYVQNYFKQNYFSGFGILT